MFPTAYRTPARSATVSIYYSTIVMSVPPKAKAGVIDKEKTNAGIFVCFANTVTKEMLKEAKSAGHIKIGEVVFG